MVEICKLRKKVILLYINLLKINISQSHEVLKNLKNIIHPHRMYILNN